MVFLVFANYTFAENQLCEFFISKSIKYIYIYIYCESAMKDLQIDTNIYHFF